MENNWFFPPHDGIRLSDLADQIGAILQAPELSDRIVRSVAPTYRAGEFDVCYMLQRRFRDEFETYPRAGAIICDETIAAIVPAAHPRSSDTLSPHGFCDCRCDLASAGHAS